MADTKKEYTSNLHPKGDMDTTVYPNVKSENIIDKDTTAYNAGKVPDSSLVSKSLDSLNEKIETNKIQTDTNKTNIATLQGDVSSLKQDNQTTKTTIAGLVSADTQNKANITKNTQDIATNTQNIENLSAVTPTDINVDSNYNLILEHDGKEITGQKKKTNLVFSYEKLYGEINKYSIVSILLDRSDNSTYIKGNLKLWYSAFSSAYSDVTLELRSTRSHSVGYKYSQLIVSEDFNQIEFIAGDESTAKKYKVFFRLAPLTSSPSLYIPTKSGTLALVEDLATKQDKRFVHTVEIHYASNGSYFCFTGTSDKNTPIDSIQDLTTVFANRDLGGIGIFGSAGLSKIHVGSSVNDTTFKKYMNNGEYTNPSEETFATVFNPTGFTITDNVTPM